MNGGGSSGMQQASMASKSGGKQPQLQVEVVKAGARVQGLFSPPPAKAKANNNNIMMSRNRTMPVTRAEYEAEAEAEAVPEWKLHCLCSENGGLPSPIKSHLGGGFCF